MTVKNKTKQKNSLESKEFTAFSEGRQQILCPRSKGTGVQETCVINQEEAIINTFIMILFYLFQKAQL